MSSVASAWRFAVVVFAILATVQLAIEAFNAPRVLRIGKLSEPLFEGNFLRERGPTTFVVQSLPAGSPLKVAGVLPGDLLRWDEPIGRWYNLVAGDRVTLTVIRGETSRRLDVTMVPASALPRLYTANYLMDLAGRLGALLLGVLIGWRRPDLTTYRGLAAAGLANALAFPYSAPADAHLAWLDYVASVCQEIGPGTLVFFAINYPDDKPVGVRAKLRRYYPWLFGVLAVAALIYYARLYSGYFEPVIAWIFRVTPIVLSVLFFWAILLAWRDARGETRVRLQWIFATIGTIMVAVLTGTLNYLAGNPIPSETLGLVQNTAALAAEAGLVYAVLRRRIFDFGFAVNRTLVFGVVGAILLGVFQIAHGIVSEFLRFDDKNKTILLSAILAVAVYLGFNQLKKVVEKIVDRLFFNSWAVNEEELKRFMTQARHVKESAALSNLLVGALDRFTGGAGCVVFRKEDGDRFSRTVGTLADAPDTLNSNDEVVLAMKAEDKAMHIREGTRALRAALALPMAHRGELLGFVLLGPRHDREPYRPDQVEALERAVRDVGLDFYSLRIEQLENQITAERRTADILRAQLETAMALGRGDPLQG